MTNMEDNHLIQRLASTQQMSVREIERSSGLSVSKDLIRRRIVETIVHSKMRKKPTLKPHHKIQRMMWVRNHIIWIEMAISHT